VHRRTTADDARSRAEGQNIGLIGSLASTGDWGSEFGFIRRRTAWSSNGRVKRRIIYLDGAEEEQYTIAQASEPVDKGASSRQKVAMPLVEARP